jgi:hypothetical protein
MVCALMMVIVIDTRTIARSVHVEIDLEIWVADRYALSSGVGTSPVKML